MKTHKVYPVRDMKNGNNKCLRDGKISNRVYLVGAGPGDPGLITLKGLEILRQADVVIYDYLVDKRILSETKEGAELICCDTLGKKRYSDGFLIHNEKINELVIKKVKQGKKVIRLKNGDPGIFSRTSQELGSLIKERIEFEIVPGVTAASAASAFSGIPLTDRRFASSCVFITGHEDPTKFRGDAAAAPPLDWKNLSKVDTLVLYMAVENLSRITKALIDAGRDADTKVAVIQDASLLTQKTLVGALGDIAKKAEQKRIKPPAIIIIGEIAGMEKDFNWFKRTKKVLFTGLSKERFFEKGRAYFHLPLIKITPLEDYAGFDEHLRNIEGFDWIVFASRYGVEYFFKRLLRAGRDSRALGGIKAAAIGNSTGLRLLDFGLTADLTPKKESSEGLLKEFKKIDLRGKKIFMPRSDISDKGLSGGLRALGAEVTASFAYRNVMPEDLPDVDLDFFDEIMFTSPSTVRNFVKRYGRVPRKIRIKCIGEVTKAEFLKRRGR